MGIINIMTKIHLRIQKLMNEAKDRSNTVAVFAHCDKVETVLSETCDSEDDYIIEGKIYDIIREPTKKVGIAKMLWEEDSTESVCQETENVNLQPEKVSKPVWGDKLSSQKKEVQVFNNVSNFPVLSDTKSQAKQEAKLVETQKDAQTLTRLRLPKKIKTTSCLLASVNGLSLKRIHI